MIQLACNDSIHNQCCRPIQLISSISISSHCKVWNEVPYRSLRSAWKKLWPDCVLERDFEKFEEAAYIDEIVSISKSVGLEIDNADVQKLVEDHSEDRTTEELVESQSKQMKTTQEEHLLGEEIKEKVTVSNIVIKDMCYMWSKLQILFKSTTLTKL